MFSGLTNQVSSWMSKKQEDETKSEVAQSESKEDTLESEKTPSPTKTGSRLEMLGSVKSQMTNWIGGNIVGFRKTSESGNSDNNVIAESEDARIIDNAASNKELLKDDDNSSATGSADHDVVESDEGEELAKDGSVASAVSTKAIQGAKNLGSFLYSAVNKAGKTVSEAGVKIKKTVEENNILGDFNKEQDAFIREKEGKGNDTAVPPWAGLPNEQTLKEECLALSTDKRNFLRSPPAGADFQFDYDVSYPVALATLAEDTNLEKMRFELVPKVIPEEKFWRNYFYRVSLICQANELNSMVQENEAATSSAASSKTAEQYKDDLEKELEAELQDFEVVNDAATNRSHSDSRWTGGRDADDDLFDADDLSDLK